MLLQLENSNKDNLEKLLAFAKQNHLQLTLIDDVENDLLLPGKPLTNEQLSSLIESSRNSSTIAMEDAHQIIRTNYNAD